MTSGHDIDRLIDTYLTRVDQALSGLTAGERAEILDDLRAHINDALGDPTLASEADARNVLERLGDPADVAREALQRSAGTNGGSIGGQAVQYEPDRTPGALEVAAIILTALFWPIGVLLAWISQRWKVRDKVVATVIPAMSSIMLVGLAIGGMVAFGSQTTTVVSVVDQVQPAEPAPPADIEPRSPAEISDHRDTGGFGARFLGVLAFLGGVIAGPFIAAIYLAIRLQPSTSRTGDTFNNRTQELSAGGRI